MSISTESTFRRWQRWLLWTSVVFAVFGLVVAVAPFSPLFAARNSAIADAYFGGVWTDQARAFHAFSSGPLGGTIAGFYVLQTLIAAIPFRRRERWSWYAIGLATLVWFSIDSLVSLQHGAAFNVYMVNLLPLAVFGVPLLATYRYFAAAPERTSTARSDESAPAFPGERPACRRSSGTDADRHSTTSPRRGPYDAR